MRKNLIFNCSILLFAILLITGCKREIKDLQSTCRLTAWQGLDDGYLRSLEYNDKGKVSVWHEAAPLYGEDDYFTIDYDHHNKVTEIKYYQQNVLSYIIHPVYNNGHITKELWYDGSYAPYDTVENIYNSAGRIVKRHSIPYQYYASFQYDAIGNAPLILLKGDDGTLYDSAVMKFTKPVREPMQAAPGMPYPIPYTNYIINQLKYTSYVEFAPDADGNIVKVYEQDENSDLQAGPQDYAVYYDSFDQVSQVENRQVWRYDNCDCSIDISKDKSNNSGARTMSTINLKGSPYITIPEMNKRVLLLRQQKIKK